MKNYELMYILKPDLQEEQTKEVIKFYEDIIKNNEAQIIKEDVWGLKELAYEIDKYNRGYYIVLNIVSDSSKAIEEFVRLARINEFTLRYIVIDQEKENKLLKKQEENKKKNIKQEIKNEETTQKNKKF